MRLQPLAQDDVAGTLAGCELRAFVAQRMGIDAIPEMFAGSEQHRPDGQMQLVNQPSAQVLADGGYAAPEPNIAAARGGLRKLEGGMNTARDEVKFRTSGHFQRRSRVVR